MNIVKEQAEQFFKRSLFGGIKTNTLSNLKSKMDSETYIFNRYEDKALFYETLRPLVIEEKLTHEKNCNTKDCTFSRDRNNAIFLIDQAINELTEYVDVETTNEKHFSNEERSRLEDQLNEMRELLVKLGYGQEVIFEEIEELKNHTKLGKKNFFQLAKGKMFDLGVEKIVEKTVIEQAWSILKNGFDSAGFLN